jgi:transposase
MAPAPQFVGIDVSKAHLDVASHPEGRAFRLPNTAEGVAALADRLKLDAPALVVLESTGGLERAAAVALADAGVPVRVVEPGRVRNYARAIGQRAKTGALDARLIARFAEAAKPEARDLPDESARELRALLDRRRQLVAIRVSEENRLGQGPTAAVRSDLEAHIAYLRGQVERLDVAVGEAIEAEAEWRLRDEVLRSVPGVGPQTSRMLLGALPELGRISGREAAALAGLAPYADDSGDSSKPRKIAGGRGAVRTALYMAALSAIRFNPTLRAFYRRLRRAGKAAKLALTAVSRKLLTIVNAMIRDMKPWTPNMTGVAT